MAVIYLKHERHGNKVACSEEEAKADEKNGWTRYSVSVAEKQPEPVAKPVDPQLWAERSALVEQYKEKFGKKPHHKKSVEVLRVELEAA